VEADRRAAVAGHELGRLGEGERLGAGELVGLPVVAGRREHRGRGGGDVVAQDRRRAAAAGRPSDHAVGSDHARDEVHVEVHPQGRQREAARADVLLGRPVMPRQREGRIRRRRHERQVDDAAHARGRGGVHRGLVLLDPVHGLRRRDEEDGRGALERRAQLVPGAVARRPADLGAGELRRAARIAHDQALAHACLREARRHPAADHAGRACHRDQRVHGHGDNGRHSGNPSVGMKTSRPE
jgi:hypothetical protein